MQRKRLYFDLETSPNIGFFWSAGHKLNIGYENIIKERAIICVCYKWEGENKVYALTWDKHQNDKKLLEEFIKVANQADELVGHNGDAFDLPWVRTRCLFHQIDLFPNYTTIDTLKLARNKFRFNSNRLNYIAQYLGIGKKIKTEFDLWKDIVLNKSETALNKMVAYCKQDVKLLEEVHQKLKNHELSKTHYGVVAGKNKLTCPECGSPSVHKQRTRVLASGSKRDEYKCQSCGKYHSKYQK